MKFSLEYLNKFYLQRSLRISQLPSLIDLGFEYTIDKQLEHVVPAKVLEVSKHPNADRLSLCSVKANNKVHSIVCGARNVRKNIKVALALPGAQLPNGMKIEKTTIRDYPSHGMLCSPQELGLGFESDGILELDSNSKLQDTVIDIDIYPNRGDCNSYSGICNELQLLDGINTKPTAPYPVIKQSKFLEVVLNKKLCDRFYTMRLDNLNLPKQSPVWLKLILARSGIKSIHPLVDITNLVMLETGQPTHAYDADKIGNKIIIRTAKKNEQFTGLDDNIHKLKTGDIVIATTKDILGIAGIMGGKQSAITEETTSTVIESAYFNNQHISLTSQHLNLTTEASMRFARGFNRKQGIAALYRNVELVKQLSTKPDDIVIKLQTKGNDTEKTKAISVSLTQISSLVGITINQATAKKHLLSLQCNVKASGKNKLTITPPSHRLDLEHQADIAEELLRMIGYNSIPIKDTITAVPRLTSHSSYTTNLKRKLTACGYHESINYSMVKKNTEKVSDEIAIRNPISNDLALMRTSLLPSFIRLLHEATYKKQDSLKLFEVGNIYHISKQYLEQKVIGGIIYSNNNFQEWGRPTTPYTFYDLKGEIATLTTQQISYRTIADLDVLQTMHPGRSAALHINDSYIGIAGQIHPQYFPKINQPIHYFQLLLDSLQQPQAFSHTQQSAYQSIKRDISFWTPAETKYEQIEETLNNIKQEIPTLTSFHLFDLYQDEESNKLSMAISLLITPTKQTMTSEEIDTIVSTVVKELQSAMTIQLRDGI